MSDQQQKPQDRQQQQQSRQSREGSSSEGGQHRQGRQPRERSSSSEGGQNRQQQSRQPRDKTSSNEGSQQRSQPSRPDREGSSSSESGEQRRQARPRNRTRRRPQQHRSRSQNSASVSVVIPLLNEEGSLPELAERLEDVLKRVSPNTWEVIFIDDGSTDDSFAVLSRIHTQNKRFKVVRFRRNYGKSAALAVGFNDAVGDIVVTMDADLQDDPNEIPSLVEKISQGFDLVSGWKRKRYDPWHKTLPSKLFNNVTSLMSGVRLHDFNCGLKAYRKEVVKTIQVYGEMHRYIPALAYWEGYNVTEMVVQHHPRKHGVSKFGMSRFLKGFLDLLTVMFTTRYVKRPLHFFGTVGALIALIGFATDVWLAVEWFLGLTSLSNRPLALFGVAMIIVGVQLISIGLIGELIVKNTVQQERYSIRERLQ